jgi:lipopolysaccharide transport system ATP-binding protein
MSSSGAAIRVSGLGKCYSIAKERHRQSILAEELMHRLRHPFRRDRNDTFWALRDVTFDVARGDVIGIIGRNGAGKSTLLKILSRITEPTTGEVVLRGRVGSLLEVGTGFHPELTGRENVFLNGAILGMSKPEIRRQFDAIVEFAGVEKFLETPVKRYSSGMYVRLAFAVAAHLRGEVLIVDEVLAVGDAEFQRKCLGKMRDVSSDGRTVLFVSHNMQAIRTLCNRGLYLEQGRVAAVGDVEYCSAQYLASGGGGTLGSWRRAAGGPSLPLMLTAVSLNLKGQQPSMTLEVELQTQSSGGHKPAFAALDILDVTGTAIMQAIPTYERFIRAVPGTQRSLLEIDLPPLIPGQYALTVWLGSHNTESLDHQARCVAFEIHDSPSAGRTFPHHSDHGAIVPTSRLLSSDTAVPSLQTVAAAKP